jgi:hypothetical protein
VVHSENTPATVLAAPGTPTEGVAQHPHPPAREYSLPRPSGKEGKGERPRGFFQSGDTGKKIKKKRQMVFQSTKCKEKIKKNV